MNSPFFRMNQYALGLFLVGGGLFLGMLGGCEPAQGDVSQEHLSFMERLSQTSSSHLSGGLNSEKFLAEVQRVPVRGFDNQAEFFVEERTSQIKQFPCGECHTQPLEILKSTNGLQKSHWTIRLQHAEEEVMNCQTCHTSKNMNTLHTLNGQEIALDHSYQLCAQCHSKQIKEWAGGAHGKRLGGWAAPRVIKNCVGCHNPHRPKLEKRWPSWSSSLPFRSTN